MSKVSRILLVILLLAYLTPTKGYSFYKPRKELTGHKKDIQTLKDYHKGLVMLSHEEHIDLLNELAIFHRFKHADSIKYYVDIALQSNENADYKKGYVNSQTYLAYYQTEKGQYKKAEELFIRARELAEALNDPSALVTVLRYWSLYDMYTGAQKDLIKHNYESIELCQTHGFTEEEAVLRHNLGFTYYRYGMHDYAHQEYLLADSLWREVGQYQNAAYTRSNLALNALKNNDLATFHQFNASSLHELNGDTDPLWTSRACRVYAKYYLKTQNPDSALYWNNRSQDLVNSLENNRDQLELDELYAAIYLKKNELGQAERSVQKALDLAIKFKDSVSMLNAYEQYREIAMQQGDKEKVYEILIEYTRLKEKFDQVVANKNLEFLKAYKEYELERNAQQASLNQKNWIIWGILILLFGLCVILYLARKNYVNQKKANSQLSQLNASKDKLFSIISHDLISPVNTLKEMLALYHDQVITEEEILQSIPRLRSRVELSSFALQNLLYWAQTQMSGFKANPQEINLKERAAWTCDLFEEEIKAKQLQIECKIPIGFLIWFDPNHFDVILRNLISNAIKFTPVKHKVHFKIEEINDEIKLEIHNQGGQIPAEVLQALEEDRVYPSSPGTKKEKGTGIGLKIAKELVKLNNAQLIIQSDSEGTRVSIYLPKSSILKAVG